MKLKDVTLFEEVEALLKKTETLLPECRRLKRGPSIANIKLKGDKFPEDAIAGIFSVLGNRDSYGDRMAKGAFTKAFNDGRRRVRHLWNHLGWDPPIAEILDLFEIGRSDLPEEVLERAPDAKGGAVVVRKYLSFPRAQEIREGVEKGVINEMSFAFDIAKDKYQYVEEVVDNEPVITRWLTEVVLYDTSDVNWGANDATVASYRSMPTDYLASQLKSFLLEVESGIRTSPLDLALASDLRRMAEQNRKKEQLPPGDPLPVSPPGVEPADVSTAGSTLRRARDLRNRLEFLAQGR